MPYFAGRYYYPDLLAAGVKIYAYNKGFMHAKVIMVDNEWATVGTANLDNRSLLLNFEVNCLFDSPKIVNQLEQAFLNDLDDSIRLNSKVYAKRNLAGKLMENVCRLFAPVL
jgi:cardiolipin synthase